MPEHELGQSCAVDELDTGVDPISLGARSRGEASARSMLSLAGVLASLYPAVTVALARFLLHERLRPCRWVGAPLALVGVLLIVSG